MVRNTKNTLLKIIKPIISFFIQLKYNKRLLILCVLACIT